MLLQVGLQGGLVRWACEMSFQAGHKYQKNENNVSTGSRTRITPLAGGDAYHYTIGVAVERHFEKSPNKLETTQLKIHQFKILNII